jgi:dephospho-CoA kinase
VGTGKSTVLRFFGALGARIWDADEVVRRELETNAALKKKIGEAFGAACLKNGRIDKKKLAQEVFSSRRKTVELERLIHPIVKKKLAAFLRSNKKGGVAVAEVPLLFETDFYKLFDDDGMRGRLRRHSEKAAVAFSPAHPAGYRAAGAPSNALVTENGALRYDHP